jgi:hypothetical protein
VALPKIISTSYTCCLVKGVPLLLISWALNFLKLLASIERTVQMNISGCDTMPTETKTLQASRLDRPEPDFNSAWLSSAGLIFHY